MTASPTVSVIIPCYNASPFLRETLDSALAQTHPPLEVIVIDDGSTDDSAAIAESYGPPVRVIRQENSGESVARNRGIDESKGEWLAFLDADDVWKPEKLAMQVAATDDGVVGVHTNIFSFGDRVATSRIEAIAPDKRYDIAFVAVHSPFYGPSSSLMVRRAVSPRFPVWTQNGEDLIYCLELVQLGNVALVTEPLSGYRRHANNQSAEMLARVRWHSTVETWMERNPQLASSVKTEIRSGWLRQISTWAWLAKAERRWSDYWTLRKHLEEYSQHPETTEVLSNRIYPQFAYRLQDLLHGLKTPLGAGMSEEATAQ